MHVEPIIASSSSGKVEKLTVVPLLEFGFADVDGKLPAGGFDLGFGVTVEDFSKSMAKLNLGVWQKAFSDDQLKEMQGWSTCLVHRYESAPTVGSAENESSNLLGYVIAHLRLIAPNRTTRADRLHLLVTSSGELDAYSCSKAGYWPQIHLTDCEKGILGVHLKDLEKLKLWMPWVSKFCNQWSNYYPLWVSLHFLEKFYAEFESFRARHLFRVLALEALLCFDKDYGQQALRAKIPKLLGWHCNLYAGYNNPSIAVFLPHLLLTDKLVDDVYTLRNKVAHGDKMPPDWSKKFRTGFIDGDLTYSDVLCEAAGAMLRMIWLKILSDNLHEMFADKKKMQKFFYE